MAAIAACGEPAGSARPPNVVQIEVAPNVDAGEPLPPLAGPGRSAGAEPPPDPPAVVERAASDEPGPAAFDRGAAQTILAAVDYQSCRGTGPRGAGHVRVMFGPEGHVASATVDGGPFPGTPAAACIASLFRGVRIPAFSGPPVTVGKSFTLY
jgi:hypothetical protein